MNKDEALKLALEALQPLQNRRDDTAIERSITAIKQALAAPQEPVAWEDGPHLVVRSDMRDRLNYKGPWVDMGRAIPDKWVPILYTTPPAAQPAPVQPVAWAEYHYKKGRFTGLTTNDINAVDSVGDGCQWVPQLQATPPAAPVQPVQEPVGVTTGCASHEGFFTVVFRSQQPIPDGTDLYTTPPAAPVHPDSARIDWLTNNPLDALDIFGHVKGSDAVRWIRQEIDNAMLNKDGATHD
jgi:hypothetical protein